MVKVEEAQLGENNKRPIFPIILIIAGLMILVGALAGTFLFSDANDQPGGINPDAGMPFPQIQRVDLSDAKRAFDDGSAVFVDVRGQTFYQNGHIPGALSIPLNQMEDRLEELNQDDWIILYCT